MWDFPQKKPLCLTLWRWLSTLLAGCPGTRTQSYRVFLSSLKGATPLQVPSRKTSHPHCNGSAQTLMASVSHRCSRALLSLVSLTTKPLYLLL